MNRMRIVALVLILAGIFSLGYGTFTYTQDTHRAKLGPIELSVKEQKTVNIPVWAGAGAILAGLVLLVVRVRD
jgi:TRAP-type C4-dicarboxylate transport system permease small subunit